MANRYFNNIINLIAGTKARASDVEAELTAISGGLDIVQTEMDLKAPLANPAFTGVPTAPTASPGTSNTQLATTQFVAAQAFSAALPAQAGANGKGLFSDGTAAYWATPAQMRTNINALAADGTLPTGTTLDGNNIGYKELPQNAQSAAYTLALTDSGKHIYHPPADTTARIFTIPANSAVAFPIGSAITVVNGNGAGAITIAITTDTLLFAGSGSTGSRILAANGLCTLLKVAATTWVVSGTGLS